MPTDPQTKRLCAPVAFKAAADDEPAGTFEAIVSVFGNVDSVGDVVMPGAFADDLEAWKSSGDPIPVIWSHDWNDPDSHIGEVLDAKEIEEGLWIKGRLDLESPSPVAAARAAQVGRLLKGRRVTQFSFAYDTLEGAWAERDGVDVYELRKLHVFEVGPTLVGANRSTRLLDAKRQAEAIVSDPAASKADDVEDGASAPTEAEIFSAAVHAINNTEVSS